MERQTVQRCCRPWDCGSWGKFAGAAKAGTRMWRSPPI
jgi:hypothetical protein